MQFWTPLFIATLGLLAWAVGAALMDKWLAVLIFTTLSGLCLILDIAIGQLVKALKHKG